MTVSTETASVSYAGNGATTVFAVPFYFLENSHIRVVLRTSAGVESTKVLTTDYTVANAGTNPSTATVTCVSFTPATGQTLRIVRDPPLTQDTDYIENDAFPAETHEEALDKLTMIAQAISSDVNRALKWPETSSASALLPDPSSNGNRFLATNSSGSAIVFADSGSGSLTNVDYKFASVAAMSSQTGMANNAIAITYGYYTANDGGHGTYRYDSSSSATVNGGTVINAAGGVGRWLLLYSGIVNVKQFGAKGDGVTLDTSAMQAAHNTGLLVYYPAGTYLFAPTITFSSGGFQGDGKTKSILTSTEISTANWFKFDGALGSYSNIPIFRDISIQASASKSGGAGIQVLPSSGESSYLRFDNCSFVGLPIGIDFVAASLWSVTGCDFLTYSIAGVQVANTNSADSGDSSIVGCVFNNPLTTGSGIWQKSSGGLKVVGNKFLGGARAYTMALEDSTSVLIFCGNSCENMAQQDMAFSQAVGGKVFVNVCITGNEFSVGGVAISTDATGFLTEVNISGNQMNMGAVGSNAIIALNAVTDFYVGGNLIKGNGGAGSSGVNITNCVNGKIGINTYANLPTPISITGSPTVTTTLDSQSGSSTTSTAGWAALGTLYKSATTSVTFPNPFLITPNLSDITITPKSTNGVIGGFVTSLTKTGFDYQAISTVTGIAAEINWKQDGVL